MNVAHAADLTLATAFPPGGAGGPGGGMYMQVVFFAAIFAIFYFLLIRPQQRQKREREQMLAKVKKGDRVVTASGLHGTVAGLSEHTVSLRVADQVRLEFDRASIGRIVEGQGERDA